MTPNESTRDQIDRVLLGTGELHLLKPFFPDRESILAYHAQRMSELFPASKVVSACESCNQRPVDARVEVHWRGIYHTAGTSISVVIAMLVAMGGGHGF